MLTQRQKQILEYTKKFIKEKGYSPTIDDIRKHFHLKSKATVHQHLKTLRNKGYVATPKGQFRGIELTIPKKDSDTIAIPLLGTIAAGEPIEATEERETVEVPKSHLSNSGEFFALRVKGESMIDEGIFDGDVVVIRKQPTAEEGETVIALLNDNEVTLKKIYREKNRYRLQPANPRMKPIYTQTLVVQGKVTSIIRPIEELEKDTSRANAEKTDKKRPDTPLPLNKVIWGDAVEVMSNLPSNSIDVIVTSPPYDSIRDYKGFSYDLHKAGEQLFRILKPGGIAVMVIQDQTKNFGKTLTSFRTILDWTDNIGFKLFECTIYKKYGAEGAWWSKRFRVDHEYMPIFLKGERPQYFNKNPLKIPSKWGGKTLTGGATRLTNGKTLKARPIKINAMKCRGTIWEYLTAGDGSQLKHQHPATFPDKLPFDFIQCFCPEDGVVLDPYLGSGTTALAAKKLGRAYIGIDSSKEYCLLAKKRIKEESSYQRQIPLK